MIEIARQDFCRYEDEWENGYWLVSRGLPLSASNPSIQEADLRKWFAVPTGVLCMTLILESKCPTESWDAVADHWGVVADSESGRCWTLAAHVGDSIDFASKRSKAGRALKKMFREDDTAAYCWTYLRCEYE